MTGRNVRRGYWNFLVMAGWLLFTFTAAVAGQEKLTLEKIYNSPDFKAQTFSQIQWLPNGKAFTYVVTNKKTGDLELWQYELKTGRRKQLLSSKEVPQFQPPVRQKRFLLPSYRLSPTGKQILLPASHDLFLYNLRNGKILQLTRDADEERDPRFSPNGKRIAFLKNHNLWVLNLKNGKAKQVTTCGKKHVMVGQFDWVYEEEFGIRTGFFWSPDGKRLSFFLVDERPEPIFPIVNFMPTHNTVEQERYPLAGDRNGLVKIGVVEIGKAKTIWMDVGPETDQYIPRIQWLPDGDHLAIQRLNRLQNQLDLLIADVRTGKTRLLRREKRQNGWIEVNHDWRFLKNGILWSSNQSGFRHLYLLDKNGKVKRQLTHGSWDCTGLVGVGKKEKWVYFQAARSNPLEREIYRVRLDGKKLQRLTEGHGWHSAQLTPNKDYLLDTFSNVTSPPRLVLLRNDGKKVRVINDGKMPALKKYRFATPKFLKITLYDTLQLNAYMIRPVDFDSTRKYPVLIYTYGGPGSQTVTNTWRNGWGNWWHQLMVQKGYIVFSVDNRGTGARGADFQFLIYKNIGGKNVDDQIAAARYLSTLPYVDKNRIGIWGWSGGGYMTIMCLLKGSDVFKTGVAVAPVTDFRNYDTIWTERYMQTPRLNPEGYAASSALQYASRLKGHLLILHGLADDNVHFANTAQLIRKFQKFQKQFDLMTFPRKRHSIRGKEARLFLFRKMTDYLIQNL